MDPEIASSIIAILVIIFYYLVFWLVLSIPIYFWYKSRNKKMENLAREFNLKFENKLSYWKLLLTFILPLDSLPINRLEGVIKSHNITFTDRIGYFRYTANSIDEKGAFQINMAFMLFKFLMPVNIIRKELNFLK